MLLRSPSAEQARDIPSRFNSFCLINSAGFWIPGDQKADQGVLLPPFRRIRWDALAVPQRGSPTRPPGRCSVDSSCFPSFPFRCRTDILILIVLKSGEAWRLRVELTEVLGAIWGCMATLGGPSIPDAHAVPDVAAFRLRCAETAGGTPRRPCSPHRCKIGRLQRRDASAIRYRNAACTRCAWPAPVCALRRPPNSWDWGMALHGSRAKPAPW